MPDNHQGLPSELEYLVFSSHKTATQTLTQTLRKGGFSALHCHSLENGTVPIPSGQLRAFAARRRAEGSKLKIISVFREPIERLASSMFQAHAARAAGGRHVKSVEETIVFQLSVAQLRDDYFADYCTSVNAHEAAAEISAELGIPLATMRFDAQRMLGQHEDEDCTVYLLRFDLFAANARRILMDMTGRELEVANANRSEGKWYESKYTDFKRELRLPRNLVEQVYSERKDLIGIFHPEGYERRLAFAIDRYCPE